MIEEYIAKLQPRHLLDVGCGLGHFTNEIAANCKKITAIDSSAEWIQQATEKINNPNISFINMDAKEANFPNRNFDVVMARGTLHHIHNWSAVVNNMLRMASRFLLIEEPFDDLRSDAKRNTYEVQQFFLELQKEIGYSHFNYIKPEKIQSLLKQQNCNFKMIVKKSNASIDFHDYFGPFENFAEKSSNKNEWHTRYQKLKQQYEHCKLEEPDSVLFVVSIKS